MTKNEEDRRVLRTRRLLQEAFVTLILEKGYDAVAIQDILDRADVGRSTFYAHYRDKEDLLSSLFVNLHEAFEAHAERGMEVDLPMIILENIKKEQRLFKALLGRKSGGKSLNHMREDLLRSTSDLMRRQAKTDIPDFQLEVITQYLTSGFLAVIVWWLDNDLPCSVNELYTLTMRLMEPGMVEVLKVPPQSAS